ncbi:hypothetical protein [Leifsonia virtsii]|uniref:Uncharacterized protein n=1 Tax=Leifsonia virtsii TaxID=3035915 RepID=A0ABT8J3B8_9MICO|nr:hypothetical protein [Leifsonia virtsii]MDN4599577.1 hypothetical protein [Leifsonia virtsii]
MTARIPDPRPPAVERPDALRGIRRAAVVVLIVSFSVTALVGCVVLLTSGFGETQGRVILTTLLIGVFSSVSLCHLAVVSRPVRAVGFVGLAISAVALVLGLVLVWVPWGTGSWQLLGQAFRWFGTAGIVALTLAQVNLLLLLAGRRRHTIVRVGLPVTIAAASVVALMLVLPILTEGAIPGSGAGDLYWRLFGVVGIVDALGVVALPVLARLLRGGAVDAVEAAPAAPSTPTLDGRIAALSATTGLDRETLLQRALDAYEASGGRP